ncbi:ABC transporter permease [Peribacillus sp. SCS-37]|uniref:ABC transporter permease n=1 Tax=Paraperibacillus esterisolvens TaxID=3115296 RepID=UPI003905C6E9
MRKTEYLYSLSLTACLLIIWELAAERYDKSFIFPSPAEITLKLWELRYLLFFEHLPPTLMIIITGLGISILLGAGLAIWMSASRTAEKAFYPILIASQTIPVIALAPIFILWFGYTIWSKVAVTVLITFFPITVGAFDGLRSYDRNMKELMLTLGASNKDIFLKMKIHGALPSFFSGLKVAVTLSVIGAAIGEWLGAQAGLGYFSRRMMTQFDGPGVFAPIILLSLLGILLFLLVTLHERILLKWRKKG